MDSRAAFGNVRARFHKRALGATLAVHGGLLALLLMPSVENARPAGSALAMFDVTGPLASETPKPPKARQPTPVPPTPPQPIVVPPPILPLPTPNAIVVALLEQADASASGGACDLTGPVQAALQTNEGLMRSLPHIPRDQRSVANAIMVWNAQWVTPDPDLAPAAFEVIRDVVAGTVAAASEECRLQPQGGPRLIMLPGTTETIVLALGSGTWRWQDVLDTARPSDSPLQVADAGAPPSIFAGLSRATLRGNETNGSRQQLIAASVRP
jgi:hypothetical protein